MVSVAGTAGTRVGACEPIEHAAAYPMVPVAVASIQPALVDAENNVRAVKATGGVCTPIWANPYRPCTWQRDPLHLLAPLALSLSSSLEPTRTLYYRKGLDDRTGPVFYYPRVHNPIWSLAGR